MNEIRERLQSAHFAARDMRRFELKEIREPIADQLHAIRLLAEELEARLAAWRPASLPLAASCMLRPAFSTALPA